MEEIRLQKWFTDCGVLSRRAAEEEIRAGRVQVNGATATIGQKIAPGVDVVLFRGKPVTPKSAPHRYLMLNKPRGYVTTMHDEKGRPTAAQLLSSLGTRLYPVGRLDMNSEGLLLFTDDGAFTERLTHPRHDVPKIYAVTVQGAVHPDAIARLREPFLLDGYRTRPARVTSRASGDDTLLEIELYEGRNRQIRRMCRACGLTVLRLVRVAIGKVRLGDLEIGKFRDLTPAEVRYLKGNENDTGTTD